MLPVCLAEPGENTENRIPELLTPPQEQQQYSSGAGNDLPTVFQRYSKQGFRVE